MTPPPAAPSYDDLFRRFSPPLLLAATVLVLAALVLQVVAPAAQSGPVGGTGIIRYGPAWTAGSGYDRYSYVVVSFDNAGAAGALPTTSLVYMSGTSVQTSWSQGVTYQEALANNWLLKDASGNYVRNVQYGAYVGDIGNPAYQQRFVANVADFLSQNGNEGVFIDDVLITPEGMTRGAWPTKYPNQQSWENAMVSFVAAVGPALKQRGFYVALNAAAFISGNGASDDGRLTGDFWRRLAPHVDGLMYEYWLQLPPDPSQLRPSGTSAWSQHWDGWLNLVDVTQGLGADFFGLMEGSTTSLNHMRYGRASFLLAWDGSGGAFVYHPQGDPWNAEWTMDIGQPRGPRYQVGVGWRRDYSGGTAIVNPHSSSSQTFALGGTYTRADGTAVSSVTLGPVSGLVLKSTGSSSPPAPAPPPAPTPPPPAPPAPAVPTNTTLPAVTGTAQSGSVLAATAGSWSSSPTAYAYQWRRCDSAGGACANVAGATAAQLTLGSADVGKRMRVVVTASNSAGSASATSNATALVAAAPSPPPAPTPPAAPPSPPPAPAAPVSTASPSLTGTAQVEHQLTSSNGTWSNSPTGYAHQWMRCDTTGASCQPIGGATAARYTVGTSDIGRRLRARVTASNAGGSASASSDPTQLVPGSPPAGSPPDNTALPAISGTPQEGQELSASTGSWSGAPTGYAFQWRRCGSGSCSSISGANGAKYQVAAADVGATLRVVVTATNPSGQASAQSNATAPVTPLPQTAATLPPTNVKPPELVGRMRVGHRLYAWEGVWRHNPTYFTYEWQRCRTQRPSGCEVIPGAYGPAYHPTAEDVGRRIIVIVTAWNSAGSEDAGTGLRNRTRVRSTVNSD